MYADIWGEHFQNLTLKENKVYFMGVQTVVHILATKRVLELLKKFKISSSYAEVWREHFQKLTLKVNKVYFRGFQTVSTE